MKNLALLLLSVAALILLTQCNQSSPEMMCKNPAMRGKVISTLMNDEAYMKQVMDSMQVKHGAGMVKHDMAMTPEMMDKMMAECQVDSSMCKKMMSKMMDMCEADQSKCDMMIGSMYGHPKVMKAMEGMKMDDGKGKHPAKHDH